jgi:hypothetical protein
MISGTTTHQTNTSRRCQVAFLKLVGLHWSSPGRRVPLAESGTWMSLLAFLIDGLEVANQNLHGGVSFITMQFVSVLAHAGFLAGLLALLLASLNRASRHPLSGINQVLDLPFNGRGKWLTYGSIAALLLLGIVLLGLSLKGTGII